eukprot:456880-Rhodomonas_salina.1
MKYHVTKPSKTEPNCPQQLHTEIIVALSPLLHNSSRVLAEYSSPYPGGTSGTLCTSVAKGRP